MQTPGSYTFLRLFLFSTALSLLSAASLTAQTTAARPRNHAGSLVFRLRHREYQSN
jgi:hypothetical protein